MPSLRELLAHFYEEAWNPGFIKYHLISVFTFSVIYFVLETFLKNSELKNNLVNTAIVGVVYLVMTLPINLNFYRRKRERKGE